MLFRSEKKDKITAELSKRRAAELADDDDADESDADGNDSVDQIAE